MSKVTIEVWDISGNRWRSVGQAISRREGLRYIQERKDKGLQARYRIAPRAVTKLEPLQRNPFYDHVQWRRGQ